MPSRQAVHRAFLATLDRFEKRLAPRITADKDHFIEQAAKRYSEFGTPNFFDLVHDHQEQLFQTLKLHYSKVIPAFGALSLAQVKTKSFKDTEEDDLFGDLAQQWIHTEGLKRSKLIADTSEADVLSAISNGMDEGLGTAAISSAIMEVTDLSAYRADMIARTETHAAANYAGVESVRNAQEKLGVTMLKAWLPTLDNRTRDWHASMDGSEPIGMEELFQVPNPDGGFDEMDRPGDPSASPDQTINCRCTLAYEEAKE